MARLEPGSGSGGESNPAPAIRAGVNAARARPPARVTRAPAHTYTRARAHEGQDPLCSGVGTPSVAESRGPL